MPVEVPVTPLLTPEVEEDKEELPTFDGRGLVDDEESVGELTPV